MSHRRSEIVSWHWIGLFAGLLWSAGCNNQPDHSVQEGMEHSNHAMQNTQSAEMNKDSVDLSTISLPTNFSVISSQMTVKPVWADGGFDISVNGYISVDERRDNKVSARFSGRIEKLFVKYNFQYIKKGERIMEIYSAELNTVQEELLLLLRDKSEDNLITKAEERLLLMGLSDSQVKDIESSGKVLSSVSILSPYEGFVYFANSNAPFAQMSAAQPSQMSGMGMSGSSLSNQVMTASWLQIREGSYVNKGQTLFMVNDLKEINGIVLIDNNHSSEISTGADVELISESDKDAIIKGKIDLLEPVLQSGQKFLSARIYLKNESGALKINSLFTVRINSDKAKQLMIPNSSVLFLGGRNIVWIKAGVGENGKYIFQVRDITMGISQKNMTSVSSGLTDQDEIALDAGYMIDRESLIKSE